MNAFWGLGQLMFSKTIVVVDKDVDVHDVSRGRVDRRHAHGSAARHPDDARARSTISDDAADLPALRRQDGHRRHAEVGVRGLHRSWPARVATTEAAGRRAAEIWARVKR